MSYPNAADNIKLGADIGGLETAAKKFIDLLGMQNVAIQNLMIKQVQFNTVNEQSNATIEVQINKHQKMVAQLKTEEGQWYVNTAAIKRSTEAKNEAAKAAEKLRKEDEAAERAKAKQRDSYLKQIKNSQQPPPGGPKTHLTPSDLVRIGEATLFKSALNNVINALGEGVQKAKDFQIEISLIRTVSQDAQLSFGQWSAGIRQVSNDLGIDLVEASKAAYEAVQSQVVKGAQTFQFLRTAGDLARTTGTDIKHAGDLLSSTILGFKLSIVEADHVAAVLFKTVELGRIKMEELSNTFGRVAPMAGMLGIKTEEVGAALSTLTRQGIKTSDATTLMINIISKLAKPTEGMKTLLKEWGFESGQAAVKTLGFVEVLRRLEKVSEGKLPDLSEFFNELRGLRGASGLTSAFGDYERDLKELNKADETYKKAIEIRAESSADHIKKFSNAAKNTFIVAYGQEVLAVIDNFIGKLGSGDKAAAVFANSVLGIGASIIAVKGSLIAYSALKGIFIAMNTAGARSSYASAAGSVAYTNALAAGLPVQQANVLAQLAQNAAKKDYAITAGASAAASATAAGQIGILTIALAGAYGIYQAYNKEVKQNINDMSNLNRIFDENQRLNSNFTKSIAQQKIDEWSKKVTAAFSVPLKANAERVRELNASLDKQKDLVKESGEAFGVNYKGAVDAVHDKIKEMNKDIQKSKTNIENAWKTMLKVRESMNEKVSNFQFKYATDDQKTDLYKMKIKKLTEDATQLYKKGDEESVKEARHKFDAIEDLLDKAYEHETEINKKRFEDRLKSDPSAHLLYGTVFTASSMPLQNKLNDLYNTRNDLEKEYVTEQRKNIKDKQALVKTEEDRLRKFEVAYKHFKDFSIMNDKGKIDPKYLSGGKLDKDKIQDDQRKLIMDLYKFGGEKTPELIKMYQSMWGHIIDIEKEANLSANQQMLVQDQDRLTKLRDEYIKRFKDMSEKEAQFSADVFSPQGVMDKMKANAGSLGDLTSMKQDTIERIFHLDPAVKRDWKEVRETQKELKDFQEKYQKAVDRLRQNAEKSPNGQLIPRKEDIEGVGKALTDMENAASRISKKINPNANPEDLAYMKDNKAYRMGDVFEDNRRLYKELTEGRTAIDNLGNGFKDLGGELKLFQDKAVDPLIKQFPQLREEFEKNLPPKITNFYGDLVLQNEKAIESVQKLRDLYREIPSSGGPEGRPKLDQPFQKATPQLNQFNIGADGTLGTDQAEYFASGGFVHPGKARGTDTIPAWLSPGEFIMNSQATRKFYSQLVSMNQNQAPRYYARGGYVTNTVGDVHVHMEANAQPSASRIARQMGMELRREIRRGNVNLS